jgi:hypothetical protein
MRSRGCALVLALNVLVAPQPPADLFAFFRPSVNLTPRDRARLESGTPLVSVLDAKERDIAVFSAIELPPTVTPERFIAWLHDVAEFRKSSYVTNVRRFSTPARLEELGELTLDDKDLDDIRECRPGQCGLKLSAAEIETLRNVVAGAGAGWKQAVQLAFRDIVLDRVRTYEVRGHAGFSAYFDRKRPRSPAGAFSGLLKRSTFLAARAPLVVGRLVDGDEAPAGRPDSFLYWSKEKIGGKSVISATHVTIFRGDGIEMPAVLMTGKQIFATHYLDACLGVTGLVRDRQNARSYLVYVNRSDVDLLGGFWGGIARHMIEERIEADGPALLREAVQKLASGDPPSAPRSAGQR